jgi:hypothetical protein
MNISKNIRPMSERLLYRKPRLKPKENEGRLFGGWHEPAIFDWRSSPGVYAIFDGSELLYIGQSRNVEQRLLGHDVLAAICWQYAHIKRPLNIRVKVRYVASNDHEEREARLIKRLQPLFNRTHAGVRHYISPLQGVAWPATMVKTDYLIKIGGESNYAHLLKAATFRVLEAMKRAESPMARKDICKAVGGRRAVIFDAIRGLQTDGVIVKIDDGRFTRFELRQGDDP